MLVVDASTMVLAISGGPAAERIWGQISGRGIHAPHLLDLEVISALRGLVRGGEIDEWRASESLSDLLAIPLRRYPHELLCDRIWELRDNLTPYDAAYVALAEAMELPLMTSDAGLAKAAGSLIGVELIR